MQNHPNGDKDTVFSFNDNQCGTQSLKSDLNLSFLFESAELYIESVCVSDTQIDLYCKSSRTSATFPYCQTQSNKIHSRYSRCIVDLPILGKTYVLHIAVISKLPVRLQPNIVPWVFTQT